MTPAETLTAAAEVLRRPGSPGAVTATSSAAAIWRAREPLAAWLESWTGIDLREAAALPEDARHALTVARQILGGDQ